MTPGAAQAAPRGAQDYSPRSPPAAHKRRQEAPKRPHKAQNLPREPKDAPKGAQEAPQRPQGSNFTDLGSDLVPQGVKKSTEKTNFFATLFFRKNAIKWQKKL